MSIIIFIFTFILAIILIIIALASAILRRILGFGKSSKKSSSHSYEEPSRSTTQNKENKVFKEDEGEYVDYEDIT